VPGRAADRAGAMVDHEVVADEAAGDGRMRGIGLMKRWWRWARSSARTAPDP
jgi:hypothetical protein